jgi:hypothetical protein
MVEEVETKRDLARIFTERVSVPFAGAKSASSCAMMSAF